MYILKNALISIKRNKGRNILIGLIILAISCLTSVTLAINNTSSKLIESYQSKYVLEATIGINRQNMMEGFDPQNQSTSLEDLGNRFSQISNITYEEIESYSDSKYVKDYYYQMSTNLNSNTISPVSIERENDGERKMGEFNNNLNDPSIKDGDFTIKGYSTIESMSEFISGTYTITTGSVAEDFTSNECLINEELATINNLAVGDTITFIDPLNESNTYTLVISGIYQENDNQMSMFSNSANTIITNTTVLEKIKNNNSELSVSISPTFILTDKSVIDNFEEELREKGLSEELSIQTNLEQLENSTQTISNVKTFAITFLIITLILGLIVLLIINMINIRERKYEIGVLRTIGMKKITVIYQFLSELLLVALTFIILGGFIGSLISVPISNSLLASEIKSSQENNNNIGKNFGFDFNNQSPGNQFNFNGNLNIETFESINAVVDIYVLLELLLIGLVITIISGTSAIISIQKFSPLTILKERT